MSTVRKQDPVVALAVSDIHISLRPPLARSEEPDWLAAMERSFSELAYLQAFHGGVPILAAGDIFDKWNAPLEVVNWALDVLPTMYAIPGNHDLPSHRPELSHRSAYGTLVRAGKLLELGPQPTRVYGEDAFALVLYGRPFGGDVPRARTTGRDLHVLLTHEYLWDIPSNSYHGADEERRLDKVARRWAGFDVVVVGDNHMGFLRKVHGGTNVLNCGTFFRRKTSEAEYAPSVGLIHRSGKVSTHLLDISQDVLTRATPEQEAMDETGNEIALLVEELGRLEASSTNFRDEVRRALDSKRASQAVREVLTEAME